MAMNHQKAQKHWFTFVLIYCLVLLLILIGMIFWENRLYDHKITTHAYTQLPAASEAYLININTASHQELQDLPKIGAVLAQEIITFRETQGEFSTKEELMQVKGIGKATYEAIAELITV